MSSTERPSKPCTVCGREMVWRRKWAKNWDDVKYCSDACRGSRKSHQALVLERAILELLDKRPNGKSICPSEAARHVDPEHWRSLNEAARDAARRLVNAGKIEMTQSGRTVDPSRAKGPVRLRRA
ncbi:MAG: DUF3253 domain-containing protein [Woeseiaceae bacterium]